MALRTTTSKVDTGPGPASVTVVVTEDSLPPFTAPRVAVYVIADPDFADVDHNGHSRSSSFITCPTHVLWSDVDLGPGSATLVAELRRPGTADDGAFTVHVVVVGQELSGSPYLVSQDVTVTWR